MLLGQTGISGGYRVKDSELFCNTVASMCMLPADGLEQIHIEPNQDIDEQESHISSFALRWNLSHTMVAYQLLRSGRIHQPTFNQLRDRFIRQWKQKRER